MWLKNNFQNEFRLSLHVSSVSTRYSFCSIYGNEKESSHEKIVTASKSRKTGCNETEPNYMLCMLVYTMNLMIRNKIYDIYVTLPEIVILCSNCAVVVAIKMICMQIFYLYCEHIKLKGRNNPYNYRICDLDD